MYTKHTEAKIVRVEHRITLTHKGSMAGLKSAIKDIPLDALLVDEEEDENGRTVLVFMTENSE